MLQFNLLPDVKQEYINAERSRRLVLSISIIVAGASIGILFLVFSWENIQKKQISDLTKSISSRSAELAAKPNINKILTVQNQLESLKSLHTGKPAGTRLFDYLNKVTPAQVVDISDIKIDFVAHTVTITGNADALSSVNKYVDTLKFTTFKTDQITDKTKAFSSVVMTNFGVGNSSATGGQTDPHPASYTISFSYDPNIFDISQKVELTVPKLITTRSAVDQQSDLFKDVPSAKSTTKSSGSN